nr:MAG TPA: hypothetical protein [Caudoviricetes sp.]
MTSLILSSHPAFSARNGSYNSRSASFRAAAASSMVL